MKYSLPKIVKACIIVLALALGILSFLPRHDKWDIVAEITKVSVPLGAVIGKVDHPDEVVYSGVIELRSAFNVKAFILTNKLTTIKEQFEAGGLIHKGTLVYGVPKERYADTYVLFGRSEYGFWEFVLDVSTEKVRFEVLVPDMSGDLP